jgi:hypothetical protein
VMPRDGAIIFRDLVGKLDVLNVECEKCGRRGRYHLHRLIERYGIDAKLFDWSDEITADCPRRQARNLNDQCGARCCSFKINCTEFRCKARHAGTGRRVDVCTLLIG